EAGVESHFDSALAKGAEDATGVLDLAHRVRVSVLVDHPLEKLAVDLVDERAGGIDRLAVPGQQRLDGDRLRHAHQRADSVGVDLEVAARQRIVHRVDHDVAVEHRRAGNVEYDKLCDLHGHTRARSMRSTCPRYELSGGTSSPTTFASSSHFRRRMASSQPGICSNASTSSHVIGPPCTARLSLDACDRRSA